MGKKGSILLVYTDGIAVVLELRYLHYEKNGLDIKRISMGMCSTRVTADFCQTWLSLRLSEAALL